MIRSFRLTAAVWAAVGLVALFVGVAPVAAHEPGMSAVLLSVDDHQVDATLQLPLDRLEIAVRLPLTEAPDAVVGTYGDTLASYIADHMSVTGDDGDTWAVMIDSIEVAAIDGIDHLMVDVTMSPPSGVVGGFTLSYDVILDYLLSHEIVVAAGPAGGERSVLGTLSHATQQIHVDGASPSSGMGAMINLGFIHVLDGADHLLFLIVLLLPAPLVLSPQKRWIRSSNLPRTVWRVLQVATAFTIGHSLTLAASAFGWVTAPSGPVEVLVALSIAVGAIHAIRPLANRGEAAIAGSFGLIHGLAFAGILDNYGLSSGASISTLLGFNFGVELAQIVTVVLVVPSLYVLSQGAHYVAVRVGGATIALAAASGWLVERLGVASNPLSGLERLAIEHRLAVVILLAALAGTQHVATIRTRTPAMAS